jgi:predicted TIM-barrel fold metal-dependent hydrolase
MADLGFAAFDADHHYYEAEDAFIRHVPRAMRKRCMQWGLIDGKKRLLVGGRVNRFIPNPTFDPVAKPGILDQYFRGRNPEGKDVATLFGELDPIHPAYRSRDAKIALLDRQKLAGCFLFPTLGVGMEESLRHDPEAVLVAFRAFNRWLQEDWGFAHEGRIFAAPYITLIDPAWAAEELETALDRDARVVVMRSAPVADPAGSRSLGDPRYDGFWGRAAEAGITVAFHSGDAGYLRYASDWGCGGEFESFRHDTLRTCLSANPIRDAMAALVCNGVYDRHPNLRVATIESGSEWVAGLLKAFKKAYGQAPRSFRHDPVEQFRSHVWVSPYYEDDLERLRDTIGADHMLFGSDYPHAEGLAEPTDFVYDLKGFDPDDVRRVMRENGLGLTRRRPV